MKETKTVNEAFGMSQSDYKQYTSDLGLLCMDKLAETGEVSFIRMAKYMISELKFKHFGDTDTPLSAYEKELFIAGMALRYLMLPEVQTSIQVAAYGKQFSDGLTNLD